MTTINVTVRSAVYRLIKKIIKRDNKIDTILLSVKSVNLFRYREITVPIALIYEFRSILEYILISKKSYNLDKGELKKTIEYITDNTYLKGLESKGELDFSVLNREMVFSPLDAHIGVFNTYDRLVNNSGFTGLLLDAVVGSGKTYMSLALSVISGNSKVIIICPKEAVENVWVDSITNELFKRNREAWYSTSGEEYKGQQYLICHYEYLDKFLSIAKNQKDVFLIVDEVHYFASQKSRRTSMLNELYKNIDMKRSVLMSGTPVVGKVTEIINLLRFVDPVLQSDKSFEKISSFYNKPNKFFTSILRDRFVGSVARITGDMVEKVGIEHIRLNVKVEDSDKYLLESIKNDVQVYIKNRLAYFEDNLPRLETRYLEIIEYLKTLVSSDKEVSHKFKDYEIDVRTIRSMYAKNRLRDIPDVIERANAYEKILLSYLDGDDKVEFREVKTIYKYLALKIQGEMLANVVGKARENAHLAMSNVLDLQSIIDDSHSKTVIFSKYISVCENTVNLLSDRRVVGKAFGKFTKDIPSTIRKFTLGSDMNPMVATFKSLSAAVRLVSASTMLLIDLPFTSKDLEQSIARVWRIGQKNDVTVYYAILDTDGKPNINSRNIDIVTESRNIVEELTGVTIGSLETPKDKLELVEDKIRFTSEFYIDNKGSITGFIEL